MKGLLEIRGRSITDTDIGLIRSLTDEYGNRSRAFISRKLSESWKWHQAKGRLKDRACRDILSVLEAKGLINLPPLSARGNRSQANHLPLDSAIKVDTSLIRGSVSELKPFVLEMVSQSSLEPLWNHLISRYHYLGYKVLVGACLKYLVFSKDRIVAALGWSSAVWKLADRDKAIGWSVAQKKRHLHRVANNTRFIIFPWVQISYLASHILSQNIRILNSDWSRRFNYRLSLLETFVDADLFKGGSYPAAAGPTGFMWARPKAFENRVIHSNFIVNQRRCFYTHYTTISERK